MAEATDIPRTEITTDFSAGQQTGPWLYTTERSESTPGTEPLPATPRARSTAKQDSPTSLLSAIEGLPQMAFPLSRTGWRKAVIAASREERYRRTHPLEEVMNALVHGVAALAGAIGFYVMLLEFADLTTAHLAPGNGLSIDSGPSTAICIYGSSLIAMYCFSTFFHMSHDPKWRNFFKVCDQAFIFIFIAATCTPLAVLALKAWWGWTLLSVIWGVALFGAGIELFFVERGRVLPVTWHIAIGWFAVLAIVPILAQLPGNGVFWVLGGGACYTIGIVFYLWQALPFHHALWHSWVALGSACHFAAIYWYAIPYYGT